MAAIFPSGTVTFLFTDIEGSSITAQEHPETWETLRARHNAILRSAIVEHQGSVFQIAGDACCAAFSTAGAGLQAAVEIQRKLQAEPWGEMPIRVRMGLHTGEAQAHGSEYHGYLTLTRAQRIMSVAHGGQILLSGSSAQLVHEVLPAGLSLRDLGEHRLKGLPAAETIWQVLAPGLPQEFPPLESLAAIPNNLPIELTSFIGRHTEIAEVRGLLQAHRLVTLTGSGGTGKTRLALRVGADELANFEDGVWFIELAPLSEPALVPTAVALVLGVREEQGRPLMTGLLDRLEGRRLLLVLDNCEHLVEACASLADAVLRTGRSMHILTTSREPLGIAGEMTYHVPSLESPPPAEASHIPIHELAKYAAVRLFAERAQEALTSFNVTDANAADIVRICHRLDGIPLAIELAAARVNVLGVGQIAARLNDRFRLLTGGGRTALPRHQTLRSLIDWSYGLLSGPERSLLRRLSAFAGGWTLEAAEQVCVGEGLESADVLDLLTHLVDKSLVMTSPAARESRYAMLETIRQYALEKLIDSGEGERVRGEHLSFMRRLAEDLEPGTSDNEEGLWFDQIWYDRMELELDNLRTALEWALRLEDPEAGLRLAGALHWFWYTRGHWHEGRRWLEEALGHSAAGKRTVGRAWALTALGFLLISAAEYAGGKRLLDEGASIFREIGERHGLVQSLAWQGSFAGLWGDYAGGSKVLGEALGLARELHDTLGMGLSLVGFGNLRAFEGNDSEAQDYYEQGSAFLRQAGDKNMLAWARRRLGHVALRRSNYREAFALCADSLSLNLEISDMRGVAASLAAIASISLRTGDVVAAGTLYGASAALMQSVSGQLMGIDVAELEPYKLAAREQMGPEEYNRAFAAGHALTRDQAIAYALDQKPP